GGGAALLLHLGRGGCRRAIRRRFLSLLRVDAAPLLVELLLGVLDLRVGHALLGLELVEPLLGLLLVPFLRQAADPVHALGRRDVLLGVLDLLVDLVRLVAAAGLGVLVGLLAQDVVAAQPRVRLLHRGADRLRRRRLRLHAIGALAARRCRRRRRRHGRRLRHRHRRWRRGRCRIAARRRRRRLALRRRVLVARRRLLGDGVLADLLRRRRLDVAVALRGAPATAGAIDDAARDAVGLARRRLVVGSRLFVLRLGGDVAILGQIVGRETVVECLALAAELAVERDALHARRRCLLRRLRHRSRHRARRRRRCVRRRRRVMGRRPLDGHRPIRRLQRDLGLVADGTFFARRRRHRAAALDALHAAEPARVALLLALRGRHRLRLRRRRRHFGRLRRVELLIGLAVLRLFRGLLRRRHRHLAARPVDRHRAADDREHRRRRQRRVLHDLPRERQEHATPGLALRRRMHERRVQRAAAERRRRLHRRHHPLDRRAHAPERLHLLLAARAIRQVLLERALARLVELAVDVVEHQLAARARICRRFAHYCTALARSRYSSSASRSFSSA